MRNANFARRLSERVLEALSGNGWPARMAYRLGMQRSVGVAEEEFALAAWPAGAPPLRIAFAADFHAGPATHPSLVRQALRHLARLDADLLLLGGDFVSFRAENLDPFLDEIAALPGPLGRYAVLGNHDHWADGEAVARRLEDAGIHMLTNRSVRLPPPYDGVWVCGLDDHGWGEPDAERAFRGADGARILLMHAPSGLLDVRGERFELALCGHTHGGQIALPGGFPLYAPHGRLSRRYIHGRYPLDGRAGPVLRVSRGVGFSGPPVRLFAEPEVLLCTVRGTE